MPQKWKQEKWGSQHWGSALTLSVGRVQTRITV